DRMNDITRVYIKNIFKDFSFLIGLIILFVISGYTFYKFDGTVDSGMVFIIQAIFLILITYAFLQLNVISIDLTVISDKASGRCELMLANKMGIDEMVKMYIRINFIVCLIPIILLNIELFAISVIFNLAALKLILLNPYLILFYGLFIVFMYNASKLFISLCLKTKKLGLFRRLFSFGAFLFLPVFILIFNLMKNTGFILTQDSLYIIFILFLLILNLILFLVNLITRRSLSKEQIILSFKQ
nr:hypothetical protein [Thermotogota bacterium]